MQGLFNPEFCVLIVAPTRAKTGGPDQTAAHPRNWSSDLKLSGPSLFLGLVPADFVIFVPPPYPPHRRGRGRRRRAGDDASRVQRDRKSALRCRVLNVMTTSL